jgi:hypothetical protein
VNYYCWCCYGVNERSAGACVACGAQIAAPTGASYVELLLWELGHPLPDRQMIAAEVLGRLGDRRACAPLSRLVSEAADPYLAAQALRSLIAIDGVARHRSLLERLTHEGAVRYARWRRALSTNSPDLGQSPAPEEPRFLTVMSGYPLVGGSGRPAMDPAAAALRAGSANRLMAPAAKTHCSGQSDRTRV